MQIMNEETFGPVVCVMKVNSIDEAIELANDSDMGLTASVWTGNNKHAIEISNRIKAGVVNINDHLMSHGLAETPWGGFKNSGKGRSHGKFGFEEMTETQVVVRDILPFVKKDLWWHPYSAGLYEGLRGMLIFRYGKGILNRLSGFIKLAAIVPRIFNQN
jgi:succinate-semialdehyde dehydrogenase/glutarate-semialdehyde dehydrogenase